MERFGVKLRQLREDKGLTQQEFASLLDMNRATISHYESNLSYPCADVLVKMANFFHVSVDQLLGRSGISVDVFDGLTEEQIQSVQEIMRQYRDMNHRLSQYEHSHCES
ncbi:helix-turn-helix domain-containing protein [Anaeromassilibacillus sp. An200]|uniref:Helix-turn-helix transcriptional regulator n=1 Tax=Candidatus Caccousia stercoris TaxID=2840723 RepID=A0A9D1K3A0_9FIRM|nr:helix-turn-helix transcriptional regulator [Anaeromassilibacillus sp. An200]OUP14316.1 hypothetical protein B5F35_00660 [Anaeromassilibacillus sp. An200]HIS79717.1 helix-turn-helix transcriptional regulator [Candidatus Caccousia stercoris]